MQLTYKPASRTLLTAQPRRTTWLPPQEAHAKLNVDVAFPSAGGYGAVRAICRDLSGVFQGASAVVFRNIDQPEVLESLAIREALALADDLYVQKIRVASDCKSPVEDIHRGTSSAYGAVVQGSRSTLVILFLVLLVMSLEPRMSGPTN